MNIYFVQIQSDVICVLIGVLFIVELFLLLNCLLNKNLYLHFVWKQNVNTEQQKFFCNEHRACESDLVS